MSERDEHLFIGDMRSHPDHEVRLYSPEGRLVSGTFAGQVARSIDATKGPRIITTSEELDALPHNSLILSNEGDVFQRAWDQWFTPGVSTSFRRLTPFPATVLWEPKP